MRYFENLVASKYFKARESFCCNKIFGNHVLYVQCHEAFKNVDPISYGKLCERPALSSFHSLQFLWAIIHLFFHVLCTTLISAVKHQKDDFTWDLIRWNAVWLKFNNLIITSLINFPSSSKHPNPFHETRNILLKESQQGNEDLCICGNYLLLQLF